MLIKRKRRLYFVILLLLGAALSASLVLYALRQNINLYYTPTQVLNNPIQTGRVFRLGGMVVQHSVRRSPNSLKTRFVLTDYHHRVTVYYDGVLPSLFREGQGIVAQGKLTPQGIFVASQVLAKHDENYKPPSV